jgi:hypothetical protein
VEGKSFMDLWPHDGKNRVWGKATASLSHSTTWRSETTPDEVMSFQLIAYDDVIQYIVDGK